MLPDRRDQTHLRIENHDFCNLRLHARIFLHVLRRILTTLLFPLVVMVALRRILHGAVPVRRMEC